MCNICYDKQTELKCDECTFECCYECILEWSERSHYCPQCKQFETYGIEYFTSSSEEESIYDFEIFDPEFTVLFEESEEENEESEEISEISDISDDDEFNEEHPGYNYYLVTEQINPITVLLSLGHSYLLPPPPPPPSPPPSPPF